MRDYDGRKSVEDCGNNSNAEKVSNGESSVNLLPIPTGLLRSSLPFPGSLPLPTLPLASIPQNPRLLPIPNHLLSKDDSALTSCPPPSEVLDPQENSNDHAGSQEISENLIKSQDVSSNLHESQEISNVPDGSHEITDNKMESEASPEKNANPLLFSSARNESVMSAAELVGSTQYQEVKAAKPPIQNLSESQNTEICNTDDRSETVDSPQTNDDRNKESRTKDLETKVSDNVNENMVTKQAKGGKSKGKKAATKSKSVSDPPLFSLSHTALGRALAALPGREAEAAAHFREARIERERVSGSSSGEISDLLTEFWILMRLSRFREAEEVIAAKLQSDRELVQRKTESDASADNATDTAAVNSSRPDPEVAIDLNNLGASLLPQGRFREAETALLEAHQIWIALHGTRHANVAASLNNLGALYSDTGRMDDARDAFRRALSMLEDIFKGSNGVGSLDVARTSNNLAVLEANCGRSAESEALFRKSLEAYERNNSTNDDFQNSRNSRQKRRSIFGHDSILSSPSPSKTDLSPLHHNVDAKNSSDGFVLGDASRDPFPSPSSSGPNTSLPVSIDVRSETSTLISNLAATVCDQGRYDEGIQLFKRALRLLIPETEKEGDSESSSVHTRVSSLYKQEFDRAMRELEGEGPEDAVEVERNGETSIGENSMAFPERENAKTATTFNNLATLYSELGREVEAENLHRRALKIQRKLGSLENENISEEQSERGKTGSARLETAATLNALGVLLCGSGRQEEAEALIRESLEIRKGVLGSEHLDVAENYSAIGLALSGISGREKEAEGFFNLALQIHSGVEGGSRFSRESAQILRHKGELLSRMKGRGAEAEGLLREAVSILEEVLGSHHPDVAPVLVGLAQLREMELLKTSRGTQGGSLMTAKEEIAMRKQVFNPLRRALRIQEQSLDPEHTDSAHTCVALGRHLQRSWADHHQAMPYLERALETYTSNRKSGRLPPSCGYEARACVHLAESLEDLRLNQQAEGMLSRAIDLDRTVFGSGDVRVAVGLNKLGLLLKRSEKIEEAEKTFLSALDILAHSSSPKASTMIPAALHNVGSAMVCAGKEAEGAQFILRSIALKKLHLGETHPSVVENRVRLSQLFESIGKSKQSQTCIPVELEKYQFGSDGKWQIDEEEEEKDDEVGEFHEDEIIISNLPDRDKHDVVDETNQSEDAGREAEGKCTTDVIVDSFDPCASRSADDIAETQVLENSSLERESHKGKGLDIFADAWLPDDFK